MTAGTRIEVMTQVLDCESCELVQGCTGPVFMSGPEDASIVVVGEAPGEQEDKAGEPFIGPAGKQLRSMLTEVGIDPTTVAFVNTVSCFPRGTPTWDHVHACAKNKIDQIALIDPTYVLPVGKVALKGFQPHVDLKHGRGRPWLQDGRVHFATYHPAAAMRNGNYEDAMLDDLRTFVALVESGDWQSFLPPNCSGCINQDVIWFEETGFGWCEVHLPDHEQEAFKARCALIERDYAEAAARADQALSNVDANTAGQAHAGAGDTERAAALAVMPRTGTQRRTVLEAIAAAPDGLTDHEAAATTGLFLYSAAPRRTELVTGGWVKDSGQRRPTPNGADAIVWKLTAFGASNLARNP